MQEVCAMRRATAALALALVAQAAAAQMATPSPGGPPAAQAPLKRSAPPVATGELPAAPSAAATPQPAAVPQINVPIGKPRDAASAPAESALAQCDALRKRSDRAQCRREAARQSAQAASAASPQ